MEPERALWKSVISTLEKKHPPAQNFLWQVKFVSNVLLVASEEEDLLPGKLEVGKCISHWNVVTFKPNLIKPDIERSLVELRMFLMWIFGG